MEKTSVTFRDNNHLMQIIDRIVSKVGRRVDEVCPMVDARLPDGSRVNAIIPPLALDGAAVSIRRFGSNPLKLEDLLNYKAFTPEMVMLLEGAIKARLNIIISGGTGSGKTTLLNTLSSFISNTDRMVTIEDAAELQLQQEHVVRLETRPAEHRRQGRHHGHRPGAQCPAYAARANHHRRMPRTGDAGHAAGHEHRPRRIADHAARQHAARRVARIETMITMAGFELPLKAMRQQIASAVDLIIQANRLQGGPAQDHPHHGNLRHGTRHDRDAGHLPLRQEGVDENGRAYGQFESTGIRPSFMDRLESAGVRLPSSAFRQR